MPTFVPLGGWIKVKRARNLPHLRTKPIKLNILKIENSSNISDIPTSVGKTSIPQIKFDNLGILDLELKN